MTEQLTTKTCGPGLYEITAPVAAIVEATGLTEGVCTVFVRHTSASLTIQENADPSARRDLEEWLQRLVPENDALFTHTDEGPDDMPSHIKAALTSTCLTIPLIDGGLGLGSWQGIYLWEHRRAPKVRQVLVHVG